MPAVSDKQRRFMGMVVAAKEGRGGASPAVQKAAGSMSMADAKDFARKPAGKKRGYRPSMAKALLMS